MIQPLIVFSNKQVPHPHPNPFMYELPTGSCYDIHNLSDQFYERKNTIDLNQFIFPSNKISYSQTTLKHLNLTEKCPIYVEFLTFANNHISCFPSFFSSPIS